MGLCGSSDKPPNPNQVDITHFEIQRCVGKGGFGKVNYITSRTEAGEPGYALKTIRKERLLPTSFPHKCDKSKDPAGLERLLLATIWTERNVLQKFKHPFLVNLKHAFQDEASLYLVMDFMPGGDLHYWQYTAEDAKRRWSESDVRFYMAEILLGLQEMHRQGVIYRDLKPQNILLDAEGHIRIIDFGLCGVLTDEKQMLTENCGTSKYQAPEMILRQPYGPSQDVWSYGVMMYEMFYGQHPFQSNEEAASHSIQVSFPSESGFPRPSSALQDLIRRLLVKNPAQRLGCGPEGWEEVKRHPFWNGYNWSDVMGKKLEPPFKPKTAGGNANSDPSVQADETLLEVEPSVPPADKQRLFDGYEHNVAIAQQPVTVVHVGAAGGGGAGAGAAAGAVAASGSPRA